MSGIAKGSFQFGSAAALKLWLSEALVHETDPMTILRVTAEAVGRHLGVTRIGYGDVEPGADWMTIPLDWTDGIPSLVGRIPIYRENAFVQAYLRGRTMTVSDVRLLDLPPDEAAMLEETFCRACVSVPLVHEGELVALFSATHREPRDWTREEVELVEYVGARTWTALRHARAAARLKESEEQFRQLAESFPGICWLAGPDGLAYWMNARGLEFYGDTGAVQSDAAAVVHPDDLPAALALMAEALRDGKAVEATLRARGAEDVYHPFLSRMVPIHDAEGAIARWCGVQVDLSEKHSRDRHEAFFRYVSEAIREETDAARILDIASTALREHLGVSFVVYSEAQEMAGGFANLHGSAADAADRWNDDPIQVPPEFAPLLSVLADGQTVVSRDLREETSIITPQVRDFFESRGVRSGVSVPLVKDGRLVVVLSAQHAEPRDWTPEEVRLVEELAERTWSTYSRAQAEAALAERERHQRFLVEWSDALRDQRSVPDILQITLERLAEQIGAARANYSELADDGCSFTIVAEHRRDPAAAITVGNSYALDQVGAEIARRFALGEVVSSDDVEVDDSIDDTARDGYHRRTVRSFLSVPLVRGGRVRAVFSVQQTHPHHWTEGEIRLLRDVADRAWVALERARAEAALQARERDQAFMIEWADAVRVQLGPRAILAATLERLGQHLDVDRANYAEVTGNGDEVEVIYEWVGRGDPLPVRRYPFAALGERAMASHLTGRALAVEDVTTHPLFDLASQSVYAAAGVRAGISVPLVRDGRLSALLTVQQASPRGWTDAELRLVCEIAERVWATLERARFEERMAESEALLATFMENAPIGMHLKDAEGRFLRVNQELALAIGRPREDILGRRVAEVMAPEVAGEVERLERQAAAGQRVSTELTRERHDGRYAAALSIAFPIEGHGLARTGGFTIDLTDRKAAEAALQRSREALYQTEKLSALGSLLAGVSHELNNPLSIVVAQAVMMERQAAGTELADRAFKIRRAADRCARIVQTFLAMARAKRPEREPVDLNAVAIAALDLAEYGLRTDGVAVERRLAPDLPRIAADADQLHQVIINLVVNAQQAMKEAGTPFRRLAIITARGPEPDTVVLDVVDNGPGVPEELQRRIFEPFFTTKPQGEGTGVGLSFSQGLAEAHGGRLALLPVESGAAFRLTLPIDSTLTLPRVGPEATAPAPAPARRALVIDDEREIAESLADFLSVEGYECDIAIGGAAAKERLGEGRYDLVVSDLRMPDVDGPELHAWVAAARPDLSARMAFITGDTLGAAAERFLKGAHRPVLEKPFTPESVRALIARVDAGA